MSEAKFGVYRPLTPESSNEVFATLDKVQSDVDKYLHGRRTAYQKASSPPQERLGTTYLMMDRTGDALRKKQIDIFAGKRILLAVADNPALSSELEVPISGFRWHGSRDRKLSMVIGENIATDDDEELLQSEQIQSLYDDTANLHHALDEAGASSLSGRTAVPNHVSIVNYNGNCDPHVADTHREKIREIAFEHFISDDLASVVLGGMIVGSHYSEPLKLVA